MDGLSRIAMITTATWGLLLGESYVFFAIIRPLSPNIHESIFSAALKLGASAALFLIWAVVMFALQTYYVRATRSGAGHQGTSG